VSSVKIRLGRTVICHGLNEITFTRLPSNRGIFWKSVHCVTECTSCSLVASVEDLKMSSLKAEFWKRLK